MVGDVEHRFGRWIECANSCWKLMNWRGIRMGGGGMRLKDQHMTASLTYDVTPWNFLFGNTM